MSAGFGPGGSRVPHEVRAQRSAGARRGRPRRWLPTLLLGAAGLCAMQAGWIHAKAALAQALLQHAWVRTLDDGHAHRPWPGADMAPVARLRVARLGIDQIVLAGDSGRVLAFGPGWAPASTAPGGGAGTRVVSGHRDTHFAWLADLRPGDALELDSASGARRYRVASTRVADSRRERIPVGDADVLLLVTCWPFDAVVAGGPQRYLVHAVPEAPAAIPLSAPLSENETTS
ncbi:class GN sortase [Coralloluteibacterium stylophorae]|uniref:Class GN sortase n=1 Tax=Coralloluteibacterium stylophorae TaxID=1776034 RepID=A0A8J8AZA4_9GAMM|nr:class GN sortase [Coralloluteibacterium stylophorae]MBS7457866.1 class GN sortase [Coralloluteibacterium stylophorae]